MVDHTTSSSLSTNRQGAAAAAAAIFIYKGGQAPRHITHARIDKSVKIIDAEAFSNNPHLISVELHDGVELIRILAFCNCTSLRWMNLLGLTDVEFGDKLESIGDDTFAYCSSLTHVTIPSVRTIGKLAFNNCNKLTDLDLPERLEHVGQDALKNCTSLRRIAIPLKDQVVFVGNNGTLFNDCPNLSTVSLVGGIHTLIASSPLQHWKNEMTNDLRWINKILPRTAPCEKNNVIQRWVEGLLVKIDRYKMEHDSYRVLMEANAVLERALFIQSRTR